MKNCSNCVKTRHTSSSKERLEEADKVMGITNKLSMQLGDRVHITDNEVKKLMQLALLPNKEVLQGLRYGKDDELSAYY